MMISVLYSFPERQWAAWLGFRRCVSPFLTSHPTAGDSWQRQSLRAGLAEMWWQSDGNHIWRSQHWHRDKMMPHLIPRLPHLFPGFEISVSTNLYRHQTHTHTHTQTHTHTHTNTHTHTHTHARASLMKGLKPGWFLTKRSWCYRTQLTLPFYLAFGPPNEDVDMSLHLLCQIYVLPSVAFKRICVGNRL